MVDRFPVHHHSANFISFSLESLGPLWYIWKRSSAHVYARGRKQFCKLHYCLWRVSIKRDSHFLLRSVFFVSKGNLFGVYFTDHQTFWRRKLSKTYISKHFICIYYHYYYFQFRIRLGHYMSNNTGKGAMMIMCYFWNMKTQSRYSKTSMTRYENTPIQIYWNFTTKKWKLSDKKFWYSSYFCCKHKLWVFVRTVSNENPQSMFLSRNMKNSVYPCKPQFYYIKVGFKRVKII